MNSCLPIPSVDQLLSTENNYVEVGPLQLIPGENVLLFYPPDNYIGCAYIMSPDNKNNRIEYRLNNGAENESTADTYTPSIQFKFFRKNFDKENYKKTIAHLSKEGKLPKGSSGEVFRSKDTNDLIGSYLGGRPRRKSKRIRKRKNKNKSRRK